MKPGTESDLVWLKHIDECISEIHEYTGVHKRLRVGASGHFGGALAGSPISLRNTDHAAALANSLSC